MNLICEWIFDPNMEIYWTECDDVAEVMYDGEEQELEFKFCPFCGKKISIMVDIGD